MMTTEVFSPNTSFTGSAGNASSIKLDESMGESSESSTFTLTNADIVNGLDVIISQLDKEINNLREVVAVGENERSAAKLEDLIDLEIGIPSSVPMLVEEKLPEIISPSSPFMETVSPVTNKKVELRSMAIAAEQKENVENQQTAKVSLAEARRLHKQLRTLYENKNMEEAHKCMEKIMKILPHNTKLKELQHAVKRDPLQKLSMSNFKKKTTLSKESGDQEYMQVIATVKEENQKLKKKNQEMKKRLLELERENQALKQQLSTSGSLQVLSAGSNSRSVECTDAAIRLYCRVRPLLPHEDSTVEHVSFSDPMTPNSTPQDVQEKMINIIRQINVSGGTLSKCYSFTFDKVFTPTSSQQDVFSELETYIQEAMYGAKVTLFAYGHTGSGKTYTIQGHGNFQSGQAKGTSSTGVGVVQKTVELIFDRIKERQSEWNYSVGFQVIEIYNERVQDLLSEDTPVPFNNVKAQERFARTSFQQQQANQEANTARNLNTNTCNARDVESVQHVYDLLQRAITKRNCSATQHNEYSSRSHCVYRFVITAVSKRTGEKREGALNLVDLAGSEKLDLSKQEMQKTQFKTLQKETQSINKSLSSLSSVIRALVNKEKFVPFRDGALTKLLMNDLQHQSTKIIMIINVSPKLGYLEKTISSLQFVRSAKVFEILKK